MKKKEQIQKLKTQVEKYKKEIIEIEEKRFDEDFNTAINLLSKYGSVDLNISIDRSSCDTICESVNTIILTRRI